MSAYNRKRNDYLRPGDIWLKEGNTYVFTNEYKYAPLEFKGNWEIQEEDMANLVGSKVSLDDLKEGDTVTVTRDVVVSSVDKYDGVVFEKNTGNKIRLRQPKYGSSNGKQLPQYTAVLKTRPVSAPTHWPPQVGDKWKTAGGVEYSIIKTGNTYNPDGGKVAYPDDTYNGYTISLAELQAKNPTLAYRNGNALNI